MIFKKVLKAVLFPHPAVILLVTPVGAAMLIYSFVFLKEQGLISYVSYFLSAYALTVISLRIPEIIAFIRKFKVDNKFLSRYLNDTNLQVNVSLYSAFIINTAYAILQLGLGFYHHTVWYYSMGLYYVILAIMRFFLLKHIKNHTAGKDRRLELLIYRFCGVLLLLMNLALSAIVFYIAVQGRTFVHHEITTIAMAAYTFGMLTLAIINVIKYRKYESPILTAARIVNLAAALVSTLTLETTMLTAFGEPGQENFRRIMTGTTGVAVTLSIFATALYMIIKSTKEIRSFKEK